MQWCTKETEEQNMIGDYTKKLDKGVCIISLAIISFLTLSIASSELFKIINLCGVFKQ